MPAPKHKSRLRPWPHPRRNIAMAIDWQGEDDRDVALLFAGADGDMLREVFTAFCGPNCFASGFTIEPQRTARWRNGYVNDRLAVILHGSRQEMMLPESLMMIVKRRLEQYTNGGSVDCYWMDDFLNLSRRDPCRIITPRPLDTSVVKPVKQKRKKTAEPTAKADELSPADAFNHAGQLSAIVTTLADAIAEAVAERPKKRHKPTELTEEEPMANIYLRVPWYVAAYYRGREEDKQLTEWQPVEFADYTHEYMVLENNLRYMPEQVQSHVCYSQRAWNNILHGRRPEGGEHLLRRNPDEWPSGREICSLIGVAYHGKQMGSEYLCIKMPREVYYNKHVHRTTPDYCISFDTGIFLASMLTRKFCCEYLEWTEYRKEFCRRQGLKAKMLDTVEMFFTQFNFPVAILPTERESLRRMHTRWLTNAKKHPAYHYNFDDQSFLEHISDDDLRRAEDRERRIASQKP